MSESTGIKNLGKNKKGSEVVVKTFDDHDEVHVGGTQVACVMPNSGTTATELAKGILSKDA